jgi:predicted RND superfamily exporter protein
MVLVTDRASRWLSRTVALRRPILVLYALLVPLAAWRAAHIPSEGGIDRLVRRDDPDYVATRAFQQIFPDRPSVLVLVESDDPFAPANIARVDTAVREVRKVPHVSAFSLLDAIRRARPGASPGDLKRLALGTSYFSRQGLVGPGFLSVVADLDVKSGEERDAALTGIDAALGKSNVGAVRRVGAPYVESWIEYESGAASARYFPFFGALVVIAALLLYRSLRTLFAFLLTLAAAVALSVAAGGLLGFEFSIISVLVPLTVLVTTLATLVYLQSRFVDRPPDVPVREHQIVALRNKLLPVSVSTIAAVLGFAALAVSALRPVREMGLWTALGLAISWVVAFTLFPALQLALRTPTGGSARHEFRLARVLPPFTWTYRHALVGTALGVCVAGAVALFGIPGASPRCPSASTR